MAREPIEPELADRVLVESDRTCCVCRDRSQSVQIHHLDEDPSNNERSNLVVLCVPCHNVVRTDFFMGRNLTRGQIRLYDQTWRKVVRARLNLHLSDPIEFEYRQQVLLELSILPHMWKAHYLHLDQNQYLKWRVLELDWDDTALWETFRANATYKYSDELWASMKPLQDLTLREIINSLETMLMAHGPAISTKIKLLILRTKSSLESQRTIYIAIPEIVQRFRTVGDEDFSRNFCDTIATFRAFAIAVAAEISSMKAED